jgi:hypothetical protein
VSYIDADVGLSLNRYEYRRYKWWDYTGERIVEVVPFTTSRQPRVPPLYPEALIMHVQIESEPPCFKSRKQKKKKNNLEAPFIPSVLFSRNHG